MKKLLSILAAIGLTATATTTVVSCGSKKSSSSEGKNKATVDDQGNVSATFDATPTQDIKSQEDLQKSFGVYDSNDNKINNATIEVVPNQFPLKAGQKCHFKISYNINPYDGTKDQKYTVKELDNRDKITDKDGKEIDNPDYGKELKGGASAKIIVPKNDKLSPDYGNIGSGKVTMGEPKLQSADVSDGNGFFKGKTKDGKEVSVDANGHLVDVTSDKSNPGSGFGKRIAGLDKDGKPLTDNEDGGNRDIIHLDNDGYRIKYYDDKSSPTAKEAGVAPGWHRVSNDGKYPLGPDTGNKAWDVNSGSETNVDGVPASVPSSVAKYVERDDKGNVIAYLNGEGQVIDTDKTLSDGTPNPNYGKPKLSNGKPEVKETMPPYTGTDATGKVGTGKYSDSAKETYNKETSTQWTLNGNATIKIGSKVKEGSVVIGDGGTDGLSADPKTAVALNPSDPSSHQWTTIPSGKYAGMQVKISDDGNSVEFQWPVKDKQIDDIVSGSNKANSSPSKDSPLDENGKINLPITYTSEKDGKGDKLDSQKVNITTPWDASENKGGSGDSKVNSAMSWWIDSTMTKSILAYDDESTSVNVYLSTALKDEIVNPNNFKNWKNAPLYGINLPKFNSTYLDVQIDGLTKDSNFSSPEDLFKAIIKNKDGLNYIQFNIKAKAGLMFDENKDLSLDFADKDEPFINGAHAAKGTNSSAKVSLSAINKTITFNNDSYAKVDQDNTASFTIDQSKLPSAVDFTIEPTVLIKKKNSNDKSIDIKQSGLLASVDGFKWDQTNYSIKLAFADGKLDKSQYELTTQFKIKQDRTESPFGPVENKLIVDKQDASTNEQKVEVKDADVKFNGYTATWKDFKTGEYVDKTATPTVNISYAQSSSMMTTFAVEPKDITWDGSSLSFKLSSMPTKGTYTVNVVFDLTGGFGKTSLKQTLTVSQDDGKNIALSNGDKDKLSFGNEDSVSFSIDATNPNEFDSKNIDIDKSSLKYQGSVLKDTDYSWDFKDGKAIITLKDEISYQKDKLNFILNVVDKKGKQLNPEIIQVAKDHAMHKYSQITWKEPQVEFNDTIATFEVADKNTMKDIDFSKDSFKLIARKVKNAHGKDIEIPASDYATNWDGSKLTLTLNKEIDKADYKFTTQFNLGNGYEKDPATTADITAAKDKPLESSVQISSADISQTAFSLDDHQSAVWKINVDADKLPPALDLKKQIIVELDNPDYEGALDPAVFDKGNMTISVKLKDDVEIPGGQSNVKITFGFKDWTNPETGETYGYGDATSGNVVAATGYVTKKEPTKGYFNIKFKSTEVDMPKDVNEAVFELDDSKGATGVDVSTKDLKKIQQSDDGGKTWTDLNADETTYTYEDGKLTLKFKDKIIHTDELHKTPRQFKVWLGIGNGYENSDYAKNNPNGFEYKGTPLTVKKTEASTYESALVIDDANEVKNFNDSNKTTEDGKIKTTWHEGTWNISKLGTDIDINHPTEVKITNTTDPDGAPYDPSGIKIIPPASKDADPEIDPTSPEKNPGKAGNYTIETDEKSGKTEFKFAIKDGSLWKGTYSVELSFKLKNYDETVTTTLQFSKTEANDNEKDLQTADGVYFENDWHHVHGITGGILQPSKYFMETRITFTKFGGAIDVTNPIVTITTDPGKSGKFFYYTTKQDPKTGNITIVFRCWQIFLIDRAGKSNSPKFSIKFGLATFGGESKSVDFNWDKYGDVAE